MQQRTHLAHSNTRTRIATTRPCGARLSHCHGAGPRPHHCYLSRKPDCQPSLRRRPGAAHTTPGAATSPLASPGSELTSELSLLEDAALAGREAARFWSVGAPPAARAAAARVATTARRSRSTNSKPRMHVRQSRRLLCRFAERFALRRLAAPPPPAAAAGVCCPAEARPAAAAAAPCAGTALDAICEATKPKRRAVAKACLSRDRCLSSSKSRRAS